MVKQLENWSVVVFNPYAPPELGIMLRGRFEGQVIRTSRVVRVEGRDIYTESGSHYHLGQPEPEYVQWCKDNNAYVPTEEQPINLKG